jgi:hypothetical protein
MGPGYIVAMLAIVAFAIYIFEYVQGINKNVVIIGLAAGFIAIVYRSTRKPDKEPIPEPIIKVIAWLNMNRSIGTDFPYGSEIEPMPWCKMRYEGDWGAPFRPWKWEVGFRVIYPDYRKEEVLVILHPFDGYVTGKVKQPAGFTGLESHDLKVLLPVQFQMKEDKPKSEG